MKIQFKKHSWVVEKYGGGFCGHYNHRAVEVVGGLPFEVESINLSGKRISNIWVSSEDGCDTDNVFLINVPNELFEVVDE